MAKNKPKVGKKITWKQGLGIAGAIVALVGGTIELTMLYSGERIKLAEEKQAYAESNLRECQAEFDSLRAKTEHLLEITLWRSDTVDIDSSMLSPGAQPGDFELRMQGGLVMFRAEYLDTIKSLIHVLYRNDISGIKLFDSHGSNASEHSYYHWQVALDIDVGGKPYPFTVDDRHYLLGFYYNTTDSNSIRIDLYWTDPIYQLPFPVNGVDSM